DGFLGQAHQGGSARFGGADGDEERDGDPFGVFHAGDQADDGFLRHDVFSFVSVKSGVSVRSGPVGGQGDGAHAVLAAGVLRLGGQELVLGYLTDDVDGKSGGLGRRLNVDLWGGRGVARRHRVGVGGHL